MKNIKDKVVIITGASSGIGEAIAKELSLKGAIVVLAARRKDRLKKICKDISDLGGESIYFVVDITSSYQVAKMVDNTFKKYGRIDVLINNAGVMPTSFLYKNRVDEWNQLIDTNIKGVLYGIGAVLSYMRNQKYGHIINISSTAAYEEVIPGATVYAMSKHAIRLISSGLRKEEALNGSNIRVTNVYPGSVDTNLKNTTTDIEMKKIIELDKQNKLSPEEVAKTVLFIIATDNFTITDITVNANNIIIDSDEKTE